MSGTVSDTLPATNPSPQSLAAHTNSFSPECTLERIQAFPVPPNGCVTIYGKSSGLFERFGAERNQYDPSAVSGLSLWLQDRSVDPFTVVVDTPGGDASTCAWTANEECESLSFSRTVCSHIQT